jgi:hypothetical protein
VGEGMGMGIWTWLVHRARKRAFNPFIRLSCFRAWLHCFHPRFYVIFGVNSRATYLDIAHDGGRKTLYMLQEV